jgi:hypothetical protein
MGRIGTFEFPQTTVVESQTEFLLGRVRRLLRLTAFLTRYASKAEFRQAMADLEREIERFDRGETDLSVSAGRFFKGRRRKWSLTRDEDRCVAVGHLEILTDDRFERSESENEETFSITSSPQSENVTVGGNWNAPAVFTLTAAAALVNPVFTDGTRTLSTEISLGVGETLSLDSENRTAVKNGSTNVLSSVSGDFIELEPGTANIEYSDSTAGGPTASLLVKWRDRWV